MAISHLTVALSICLALCASAPVPIFKSTYMITGHIRLPYAEIVEPFTAYLDTPNKRSRVEYYNGKSTSVQRGPGSAGFKYGTNQEFVYYSDQKVLNQLRCFEANGTSDAPQTLISILPNVSGFSFVQQESLSGVSVNVFRMENTVGAKKNRYTLYTRVSDNTPMRYEMMGYDSLIGSHFDKYYVDYDTYSSPHTFTDADFAVPQGLKCGNFPGPGQKSVHAVQPIHEFVLHHDKHVDEAFEDFKATHGRNYEDKEHETRKHVFRQNLRFINSYNRAGLTYTMGVNHLADFTQAELKMRNGYRYSNRDQDGTPFNLKSSPLPDQMDWRLYGAVTPVKDQAICGSCWSFGTTGTIEGALFLKHGSLIRLSQQELMDCSWGFGNNACDGGEDFRSYKFIMANGGLSSEEQYGPYSGADGQCRKQEVQPVVSLHNYTLIPQGDQLALKLSITQKGPISVGIDASHKSLSFYANGVYFEPKCRNDPDGLDHAVLAVGYGTQNGQDYWLVKNSWSTYWGNDGYVLMSLKDNNCGVATAASFVEVK